MNSIPPPFLLPETDRFADRADQSYSHWKGLITDAATARGLLGYLDGTTQEPTSNPIPSIYVPSPWFSKTPYDEEWVQREATAHSLVFGNLVNPVALGLARAETTAQSWSKLESTFGKTTSLGLVDAQRKLRSTFWDGMSDIEEHIKLMRALWSLVNEHGGKLDDAAFSELFITSLPHSWDDLLPILDTLKGSIAVIAHCQRHYARKNSNKGEISSPSTAGVQALVANSNLHCTNCKKVGHLAPTCFAPGPQCAVQCCALQIRQHGRNENRF